MFYDVWDQCGEGQLCNSCGEAAAGEWVLSRNSCIGPLFMEILYLKWGSWDFE